MCDPSQGVPVLRRLRAWYWRRRHCPYDWAAAMPDLRTPSHVRIYPKGKPDA